MIKTVLFIWPETQSHWLPWFQGVQEPKQADTAEAWKKGQDMKDDPPYSTEFNTLIENLSLIGKRWRQYAQSGKFLVSEEFCQK